MDAVQKANSGHPGMPMGMADVATILFSKFLKFNPKNPDWADRDRFVLSAGHGSMLLYSLLYLTGYEDMTIEQIKNFRQLGAITCGHPEYGEASGIETTTGPLGQGLANAVGMALAEKLAENRYGQDLVNHYTYTIAGDGCLMEGISQEAISLAGHLKLSKLIVLFDDNKISIDGPTSLTTSEDHMKRFDACGWHTIKIDGHDFEAIEKAIIEAQKDERPSMIACETVIAKGSPNKAGTSASHGAPLGDEEIELVRKEIGWNYPAFEIPEDILNDWREVASKSNDEFNSWIERLNSSAKAEEFNRVQNGELPDDYKKAIEEAIASFEKGGKLATRKSSGNTIQHLAKYIPELIGGSADLTGSNLTKETLEPITANDFSGSYIYYGIREHAMCAIMNGMILHGGFRPYGGTFFVFTDYCKPSIRLAALMKLPVIYVMTHDSIGLGEDGPTHQPIEHLAALRAVPNINVFRPADAIETAESWQLALEEKETPSVLVLTRQGLETFRDNQQYTENLVSKGAYAVNKVDNPDIILLASGSEVSLCLEAAEKLKEQGKNARVVSMPSWEKFDAQSKDYQDSILAGEDTPKIAVEAAAKLGWEKYIGRNGKFIGMESFGASAPANQLFEKFGITADNIVNEAKSIIK
jgi:transketolase